MDELIKQLQLLAYDHSDAFRSELGKAQQLAFPNEFAKHALPVERLVHDRITGIRERFYELKKELEFLYLAMSQPTLPPEQPIDHA